MMNKKKYITIIKQLMVPNTQIVMLHVLDIQNTKPVLLLMC